MPEVSPSRLCRRVGSRLLDRQILAVLCACVAAAVLAAIGVRAGSLASVAPAGASAAIAISITGTGFNTTAASNVVTFTPLAGAPLTAQPSSVVTISATQGVRKLRVTVPAGLPVGTTDLSVRNVATGEMSYGKAIEVLELGVPVPAAAPAGAANLAVRLEGSPNTRLEAGNTRASFGAGVTVHSTTVESPTVAIATISISATATRGQRGATLITGTQTLTRPNAFTITEPNGSPVARPGGPYSGTTGVPIAFDGSGSSDPDGDPLTYEWSFGDQTTATGPSPQHAFATEGTYTVALTVRDSRGGAHTATTQAVVARANAVPVARIADLQVQPRAGEVVTFDGSTSTDADGDPLEHTWQFGDGGTGAGPSPTHTYSQPGTFTVVLTVTDSHGASGTTSLDVVVRQRLPGRGVITGRVLNQLTGHALADATVQLLSVDGQPIAAPPVLSDGDGRFRLSSAPGLARFRVTRDGFIEAERHVDVHDGRRVTPLDARLTPVDPRATPVSAVAGGRATSSDGSARLTLEPGSLSTDVMVHVTRVRAPGLAAPLPLGWSALAAAHVTPDAEFLAPARLSLGGVDSTPPAVFLARYDNASGLWVSVGTVDDGADPQTLEATIFRAGQHAFVVADSPESPPMPVAGQPLEGVPPRAPPAGVTASITPAPRILFARPGARSDVALQVNSDPSLPSGTPARVEVSETYGLAGGGTIYLPETSRVLTLDRDPAAPGRLRTSFISAPSRDLPAFRLRQGAIDLAATVPAQPFAPHGHVLGPEGGQATGEAGERLTVLPGASAADIPVLLRAIPSRSVPLAIPAGLTMLSVVALDLHGLRLTHPATLDIPSPPGSQGLIVVARIAEVGGESRLELVAIARPESDRLVTTADPLGTAAVILPGISSEGVFLFLRADLPLGYVTGLISGGEGQPVEGALVTGGPLVGVSGPGGRYTLLAPPGSVEVIATAPSGEHTLRVTAQVDAPGAVAQADLALAPQAPSVRAIAPAAGATNVPLASSIIVTFSEPVDPATVVTALRLTREGSSIPGSISVAPGSLSATFRPDTLLESSVTYTFVVDPTVRDLTGTPMVSPLVSQFTTADVIAPPRPAPGAIALTIPDSAGLSTISGSAGSADPGGQVRVRNLRTNAITTLTPSSDGSFSGVVQALRSDRLELTFLDAAGNQTVFAAPSFRNADGSVVVGSEGGRVEGAGGVVADVPAGAVPDGTVVRLERIAAEAFPLAAPAEFALASGVRLDLGGITAQREITVSVPAPADAGPDDQILVARPVTYAGAPRWTVVERARFEQGAYQTASWPFPGIRTSGEFAFLRTNAATGCISYVAVRFQFTADALLLSGFFGFVFPMLDVDIVTLPAYCGAQLQVEVVSPNTQQAIEQATYLAPAARNDIAFPPEPLTDDRTPPRVISLNNPNGNEVQQLELRFSKRLDPDSVASGFIVRDSGGNDVPGTIELADLDSLVIFRPHQPFRQGERYTIVLFGVEDRAGNLTDAQPITFTPFGPRSIRALRNIPALETALKKCSGSACSTSGLDVAQIGHVLFIANGVRRADELYEDPRQKKLLAVDITDPFNPREIGWHTTTTNPRALATVQNAGLDTGAGRFSTDLLLVGGGGRDATGEREGKLEVYDVGACTRQPVLPGQNCLADRLRGFKFLSSTQDIPPRPGVPPDSGVPLQVSVLHQAAASSVGSDTILAYVVIPPIGLEAIDVTTTFGCPQPGAPCAPDGVLRGDFTDLAVLKHRVLAVGPDAVSGEARLHLLSAQLARLRELPPPAPPGLSHLAGAARVGAAANVVYDVDGDGRVGTPEDEDEDERPAVDELFDLAIVSSGPLTEGCARVTPCGELYVLNVSEWTLLKPNEPVEVLERIPTPGAPFSIQIDPLARLAYVELRGAGIATIDLNHLLSVFSDIPATQGLLDTNDDGIDDRIVSILPTGGAQADIALARIKIDFNRGLAFVSGGATGVEILQVASKANELALDFKKAAASETGDRNRRLREEREVLLRVLQGAVARLRLPVESGGLGTTEVSALEQGSGSCFWRPAFQDGENGPSRSCGAFQPGRSDHDIEVFVPQALVESAQVILNAYVDEPGVKPDVDRLGDLSMYAMPREAFANGELLVGTPLYGEGVSDATGDLGMGRQLLLLLWILEGEYVEGLRGGLPLLDDLLDQLRQKAPNAIIPDSPASHPEVSAIPLLEGYEWSWLQEFNANKTGARLRVKGACSGEDPVDGVSGDEAGERGKPLANFNDAGFLGGECQDEIHTVAKAAIRSALARIAAEPTVNPRILQLGPSGAAGRDAYRATACFDFEGEAPGAPGVPCDSFEHYIASVARRIVDDPAAPRIFQPGDEQAIYEFYCAKVDCRDLITSDEVADAFVWRALRFISRVQQETRAAYEATVRYDTKLIGAIPNLVTGPGGGQGIAGICEDTLQQHAGEAQAFLLENETLPSAITTGTRRKFLRLCNLFIVADKVNGDASVPVDPNHPGLQGHVVRDSAALEDVRKHLGVKRYVDWTLKVRALNLGGREVRVNLSLSEGDGNTPQSYQSLGSIPVGLAAGEARFIERDATTRRPHFALFFNLQAAQLAPGAVRALAFFLDPERTIPEANKRDNQAGLFYYVLPVEGPSTFPPVPPVTPDQPVPVIANVEPDPLAIEAPRLSFDLTLRRTAGGTAYGGKTIVANVYEEVQVKYTVRNQSARPLYHVQVVRNGRVILTHPELAPAGQTGDRFVYTDPAAIVPAVPGRHDVQASAGAFDRRGNQVGPLHDSASIDAVEGPGAFSIRLFDASALADPQHPLSRFLANHDEAGRDLDIRGAVTDGDEQGGGARIRVEVTHLVPGAAEVGIGDGDLPGVVDDIGRLQAADGSRLPAAANQPANDLGGVVQADASGRAVFYYRPPATFVRDAHRAEDLARLERTVRLHVRQGVKSSFRRVVLHRPPVFLVHGLLSTRGTWNEFQPLVPSSGLATYLTSVAGFDGRFDVFAVGTPFASATMQQESAAVRDQIRASLAGYLPGFSLAKVDVVGHSMGGLLARMIANEFVGATTSGVTSPERLPFRKLITIDTPFEGSPLADKIVEIRGRMPLRVELTEATRDYMDVLTSIGEDGTLTPELKLKAKLEGCALMIQTAGLTPRFFTHGAVDQLRTGSPELQQLAQVGIRVPSHHIAADLAVPELAVGLELETLWALLGYICKLTPDPETLEATNLSNVGFKAALTFVPGLNRLKLPGYSASIKKFPLLKLNETTAGVLRRFGPLAKFAHGELTADGPAPVFAGPNDRAVSDTSQYGGLSIASQALTTVTGRTDHTEILESPGAAVAACGDLTTPQLPAPSDLNGDGTPDIGCRLIYLLEASPSGPLFFKQP